MIESLTLFLDNYKSKIKNPLIGTIISVWTIHNWRIVYALFNFDKECTLQDRINFIDDYFSKKEFWIEVIIIVVIAFGVIIATFILLGISRYLTNLYYKVIEPWIIGKVSRHEIFTIDKKVELELEITGLKEKIERLKDQNTKAENLNTFLQNRNQEIETKYNNEIIKLSQLSTKSSEALERLENKNIPANKVINHFDGLIKLLSDGEKEQLKELSKDSTVKNSGKKQTMDFQNKMFHWGFLMKNQNENYGFTVIGLLFLEYYKAIDDLPF